MIKSIFPIFILLIVISSCCALNISYSAQPTNCQCKKFNSFVRNSLELEENSRYWKVNNITTDSLLNVILNNSNCWIGKSFDFVKQQFPPPIKKLSGSGFYYAAKEDFKCKTDCTLLHFQFSERKKQDKITAIEAVLTNNPREEYKLVFLSVQMSP